MLGESGLKGAKVWLGSTEMGAGEETPPDHRGPWRPWEECRFSFSYEAATRELYEGF